MSVQCYNAPLDEVARSLRTGDQRPHKYLGELWERVEEIDSELKAFVPETGRRDRVAAELAAVEHEYSDGRPVMYGVPVGVKDIFNVRGILTRGGSDVPARILTGPEASVVERLRAAGAVVMGKTVTTEFAYTAPGPTRNPHNLEHTPGGSSSGSAAGVAAGLFPLAVGSQTGGSVIRPAAFCGVVGFKPTHGRIPADGVLPLSSSLDTVGLFTQDVAGMQRAASVVCDDWESPRDPVVDPTLGVPADAYLDQASPEGRELFETHLEDLAAAGYEIQRTALFTEASRISEQHQTLMKAETALAHHEWFESSGDEYRDETADFIAEGRAITTRALAEARAEQTTLRSTITDTMADAGIDAWVSPAAPGPAPEGIDSTGDSIMNRFWTYVGMPATTVPAGTASNDLPVGLQCTAAPGAGESLLNWAADLRTALT